jgi:hypothetical protein
MNVLDGSASRSLRLLAIYGLGQLSSGLHPRLSASEYRPISPHHICPHVVPAKRAQVQVYNNIGQLPASAINPPQLNVPIANTNSYPPKFLHPSSTFLLLSLEIPANIATAKRKNSKWFSSHSRCWRTVDAGTVCCPISDWNLDLFFQDLWPERSWRTVGTKSTEMLKSCDTGCDELEAAEGWKKLQWISVWTT